MLPATPLSEYLKSTIALQTTFISSHNQKSVNNEERYGEHSMIRNTGHAYTLQHTLIAEHMGAIFTAALEYSQNISPEIKADDLCPA